jgi:hypothetical protein
MAVDPSRRVTVASTRSCGSPGRRRSARTRRRSAGSARANAAVRENLAASRTTRQAAW